MPEILTQALRALTARGRRTSLIAGSAAGMVLGMMAAFGTTSDTPAYPGSLEQITIPAAAPQLEKITADFGTHAREVRIQQGDTVTNLLSRMGIQDDAALAFMRSNGQAESIFRQLVPGKTLSAQVSASGKLESLLFPLNDPKDAALQVTRADDGFKAAARALDFDTQTTLQSAVIRHSLFGAADDAGIPEAVAEQLADIFGGDIDFHRDLRKGDRFSVIYEAAHHLGKPLRSQRILAAEFVNDGQTYRAFWFQDKAGRGGYYNERGSSVKKAFLRSPLEFSRITSGFTNARYHPVLRETRAHRGIDYGAPTGTRVKATGDGVVDFVGIQGGYGKLVRIRHPGDKVTLYGHLSGFAAGIRKGARVSQGEVIGFVGATGLATGPHLHYEFQVAGVHRNPLTVALPSAAPLHATQMAAFDLRAAEHMAQISAIRDMQLVRLD